MSDAPELLPCPFCGGAMEDRGYGAVHIAGPVCPIGDLAIDVIRWNRRADHPAVKALVAEAVALRKERDAFHGNADDAYAKWVAEKEAAADLAEARAESEGAHMIIAAERSEVINLRAENVRLRVDVNSLRAETDAFRMCVNCGLVVPSSHDRAQPGPGCKAPDACTFDMTPREAWEYWRGKAHHHRDAAALASHEGESNEL